MYNIELPNSVISVPQYRGERISGPPRENSRCLKKIVCFHGFAFYFVTENRPIALPLDHFNLFLLYISINRDIVYMYNFYMCATYV